MIRSHSKLFETDIMACALDDRFKLINMLEHSATNER